MTLHQYLEAVLTASWWNPNEDKLNSAAVGSLRTNGSFSLPPLWASWDVCGRLSALSFLLAHFPWSCVHSTWTQRQRQALSMMSSPQTGKKTGFSLFLYLCPPTPPSPSTPDTDTKYLPPQISFPLISPHPSFVFTAQICCNTRDQSGGWFPGRSFTAPADPRLTAG